ncbi:bifunctional [glutamate--ammonia ligase]-adenylyl-L-tyrosine phosphorylase/[glutamate--ammonia-ligase] adenylyltransferase [Salinibius halmophilus]|uniref:bifunctional [glutamate--ammonia ligase]-adenylyl-L-tyrosine phosphorylase/[glutamate--ammonia-ligase] adenylyltransferase n=1 Tax=Salinibius halmophilus TaxID=1853216 RepID=UPI000E6625AB|nr:bifunctional [glutamate--ammonia ligase]-adenylyl-L-tyrosine phosphorylase/[glutamate--ammonia-ligase] adenylyltransferase [Salinibius halmophilus]
MPDLGAQPSVAKVLNNYQTAHPTIAKACVASNFFSKQLASLNIDQSVEICSKLTQLVTNELANLQVQVAEGSEADVMSALRRWRNLAIAEVIYNDVNRFYSTEQTTRRVTEIADTAIQLAEAYSYAQMLARYGEPQLCPYSNQPQRLVVIGMGKLGAWELNLSSDIDLIFAYSCEGECSGEKQLSHQEFFTRQGRLLIKLLDQSTPDGFVFRTDMRLRPWGQSGPLATPLSFLEKYYQDQGRDWERFAMIKSRAITGSEALQQQIRHTLRAFSFRRYVDFRVMDSLRDMKRMISNEVRRQANQSNIKLGEGGIREIEFIVQAIQLIRGGQDTNLQDVAIYQLFDTLKSGEYLPIEVVDELRDCYCLLRDTEHLLQGMDDKQTQLLPADESARQRLAYAAGYESEQAWLQAIDHARQRVRFHFEQFIADEAPTSPKHEQYVKYWQTLAAEHLPEPEIAEQLTPLLTEFNELRDVQRLTGEARERLDTFMPVLIAQLVQLQEIATAWQRISPIIQAILRRSVYLALLNENPVAIRQLVKLVVLSPWIAKQLQETPFLLDELTDPAHLYRLPRKAELMDELRQLLIRLPEDDPEQLMDVLRQFKRARVLRAAACEVTEALPLMKISDYLTWLAETILAHVIDLAWQQLTIKHGRPQNEEGELCDPGFAIVAYGKLGGIELSYESDLDLVFMHNGAANKMTEGPKQVDTNVFFTRLGQRIIQLLATLTPAGMLYEVDMRLRPSGNSGLLVTTLTGFEKYQRNEAWTWEHQALSRARYVAGDLTVRERYEAIRHAVLAVPREAEKLREQVIEMRDKMRKHLASPVEQVEKNQVFHIKHDPGGIVDLEFVVQYAVLALSANYPQVTQYSDNMRIIDTLRDIGYLSLAEADAAQNAYLALRGATHRCLLHLRETKLTDSLEIEALTEARAAVTALWQSIMHGPLREVNKV